MTMGHGSPRVWRITTDQKVPVVSHFPLGRFLIRGDPNDPLQSVAYFVRVGRVELS